MSTYRWGLMRAVLVTTACTAAFCVAQAAFAATAARIRLPEELRVNTVEYRFDGIGGSNRGRFTGAGFQGPFTRSESRLGIFDPMLVMQKAGSSFTLEDATGSPIVSAECKATRDSATLKAVTFDINKMAYDCVFSASDSEVSGRIVLGEPKPRGLKERLVARSRRRGEGSVAAIDFSVESIHDYEGSNLGSQTALGYVIRSGDDVIAAVDLLDWNPIVHVSSGVDERLYEVTMAVAIALALLRDPATSALDE